MKKLVSVIIPVFNAQEFIEDCLLSISHQTYSNLEILVIDDASTDASLERVARVTDSRIRVIRQAENFGLAASVNRAIRQANGDLIARMDADDIALPTRMEKQVDFLTKNPDIDIVGTAMQSFGYSSYVHRFPAHHEGCKARLLFNVCFGHPTVMMKRYIFFNDDNFYKPELQQYSEEYELWCRLTDRFRFANLPEVLLRYRTFDERMKRHAAEKRKHNSYHIRSNFLHTQLAVSDQGHVLNHDHICNLDRARNLAEADQWVSWLTELDRLNQTFGSFNPTALRAELTYRVFELRYANTHLGRSNLIAWYGRSAFHGFRPSLLQHMKFVWRTFAG